MIYEKDLPIQFRTWVEFYDEVKPYEKDLIDVFVQQPIEPTIVKKNSHCPPDLPKQKLYSIQDIKNNALEELLSDRMERQDVVYFTEETRSVLRMMQFKDGSKIFKHLENVKRILLTLAPVR